MIQPIATRVIRGQLVATLASAALWGLLDGTAAATAAFVGGMIALIPGLYFAVKVFSRGTADSPQKLVRAFYTGEAVKFGLTIVLFAWAVQRFAAHFLPLIVTFIAAVLVYWVALISTARHTSGKEQ